MLSSCEHMPHNQLGSIERHRHEKWRETLIGDVDSAAALFVAVLQKGKVTKRTSSGDKMAFALSFAPNPGFCLVALSDWGHTIRREALCWGASRLRVGRR